MYLSLNDRFDIQMILHFGKDFCDEDLKCSNCFAGVEGSCCGKYEDMESVIRCMHAIAEASQGCIQMNWLHKYITKKPAPIKVYKICEIAWKL